MIGSSVVNGDNPNQLAKRLEIIVGSLNAGNNSRILKNDLRTTVSKYRPYAGTSQNIDFAHISFIDRS